MPDVVDKKKVILVAAKKGGLLDKLANELIEKHSDRYDVSISEAIDMTYFRFRELENSVGKPSIILSDYTSVGTMNSYELNKGVKQRVSDVPVLVCTNERRIDMNCREQDLNVLFIPKARQDKALDMLLRKMNSLGKSGGRGI